MIPRSLVTERRLWSLGVCQCWVWRGPAWTGGRGKTRGCELRHGAACLHEARRSWCDVAGSGIASCGLDRRSSPDREGTAKPWSGGQRTAGSGSSGRGAVRRSRHGMKRRGAAGCVSIRRVLFGRSRRVPYGLFWVCNGVAVKAWMVMLGSHPASQRKQGRKGFGPSFSSHD